MAAKSVTFRERTGMISGGFIFTRQPKRKDMQGRGGPNTESDDNFGFESGVPKRHECAGGRQTLTKAYVLESC